MKKVFFVIAVFFWSLWCIAIVFFHWGTLQPPPVNETTPAQAKFYPKTEQQPLQHLVLSGPPYARGVEAGILTKHLLYEQERELTTMLKKIFPWRPLFHAFELLLIPIFKGVEHTIPNDFLLEMYGVSKSTDPQFDIYAEAYTRQLAYHGLHEVGQMMVDQYQDDRLENMGCTALLVPHKTSWLVGRNFDFEGGSTLDEKKILKWVFPEDNKYAYVSVIWAGMVGAVTAINEHGLYLSINAAGSNDFNRHGLPSTLLVTHVMQSAKNSTEALELIKNTPIMITEIFVFMSSKEGRAYRIEKSPTHTAIIRITAPSAVTNHLLSTHWKDDATNIFRSTQLTSHYREARGQQLVDAFPKNTPVPETEMAHRLRDKKALNGAPLPWGNRRAIDPMIANHSVIFNGENNTLYVSAGPHLTDSYVGYNLAQSFASKKPQHVGSLHKDPDITPEAHSSYLEFLEIKNKLHVHIKDKLNSDALLNRGLELIVQFPNLEDMRWNELRASLEKQKGNTSSAKFYLNRALSLSPPYARDIQQLEETLNAL